LSIGKEKGNVEISGRYYGKVEGNQTYTMKPIGKVTHYFGKSGVAIVKLEGELKLGDHIRFEKGDHVFEQEVTSLHKEYQPAEKAEAGDEVGVKVTEKAGEGTLVVLMEEGA